MSPVPRVLVIAGSDSAGCSGLQSDLRTLAAYGCHPLTAVTAVTVQGPSSVERVEAMSPELVREQIDAAARWVGIDAIKIGLLASEEQVAVVAEALDALPPTPSVLDPVLAATSGSRLAPTGLGAALAHRLLGRVTVATPNLDEATQLASALGAAGETAGDRASSDTSDDATEPSDREKAHDPVALCRQLAGPGRAVLVKGGHGEGEELLDVLFDGQRFHRFQHQRLHREASRGTGCTLSTALAASLATHRPLVESVAQAVRFTQKAIEASYSLDGTGQGPVNALHRFRNVGSSS